jgi:hypothetical protein
MVFREQVINRMESERVPLVDSWKTYVSQATDERLELIVCQSLQRGQGKARSCM